MRCRTHQFLLCFLAVAALAGCERRPQVGIGVLNKTGMMITNCIVHFDEGDLNTGVVLTNARRDFSYFSKPISENASIEVLFPDGQRRSMKAHVGSKFDPAKRGTVVFEIGSDDARVSFERARN
ncbi:MAG: hypothetical protein JSS51_07075 [Planctomycetes bacterium]|nr:hypothetical protein [Planctomycetota bacterium]